MNLKTSTNTYKENGEYITRVSAFVEVTFTKLKELQDILVGIENEYGSECFCSIDSDEYYDDKYIINVAWNREPTVEELKKLLDKKEYDIIMYKSSIDVLRNSPKTEVTEKLLGETIEMLHTSHTMKDDLCDKLGGT